MQTHVAQKLLEQSVQCLQNHPKDKEAKNWNIPSTLFERRRKTNLHGLEHPEYAIMMRLAKILSSAVHLPHCRLKRSSLIGQL